MTSKRTIQDLLAERRANVLEAMRARDPITRMMLEAHVACLDVQIRQIHRASPSQ